MTVKPINSDLNHVTDMDYKDSKDDDAQLKSNVNIDDYSHLKGDTDQCDSQSKVEDPEKVNHLPKESNNYND